jgi:hypothetical protein
MGANFHMTKACSVVSSSENQLQEIFGLLVSISGNNENIRLMMKCYDMYSTVLRTRDIPNVTLYVT